MSVCMCWISLGRCLADVLLLGVVRIVVRGVHVCHIIVMVLTMST